MPISCWLSVIVSSNTRARSSRMRSLVGLTFRGEKMTVWKEPCLDVGLVIWKRVSVKELQNEQSEFTHSEERNRICAGKGSILAQLWGNFGRYWSESTWRSTPFIVVLCAYFALFVRVFVVRLAPFAALSRWCIVPLASLFWPPATGVWRARIRRWRHYKMTFTLIAQQVLLCYFSHSLQLCPKLLKASSVYVWAQASWSASWYFRWRGCPKFRHRQLGGDWWVGGGRLRGERRVWCAHSWCYHGRRRISPGK